MADGMGGRNTGKRALLEGSYARTPLKNSRFRRTAPAARGRLILPKIWRSGRETRAVGAEHFDALALYRGDAVRADDRVGDLRPAAVGRVVLVGLGAVDVD